MAEPKFVDTTPQVDDNGGYEDGSHIPDSNIISDDIKNGVLGQSASKIATWIRQKRYGIDVREALALFVEWIDVRMNDVKTKFEALIKRQESVEERQTDVENDFKNVIANATKDSEVILARDSAIFGTKYTSLDDRLEYIETLLSKYVPTGYTVTIPNTLGRKPNVAVTYYEYAIDTEPQGLGTQQKSFGGTTPKVVQSDTDYPDSSTITVSMPKDYKLSGEPIASKYDKNVFYIIDTYKTLRFELS